MVFKRHEVQVATCNATASALAEAAIVPTNMRRYILHWMAQTTPTAVGSGVVALCQAAGTGAAAASMQLDWFQFTVRGQQAWRPDEWMEDSLPIAIIEASCHTLIRNLQAHSFRAKVLYVEGV